MDYSINKRSLYIKYRKWFCVLNSYSINRNIQLRDIQLSGVHCIYLGEKGGGGYTNACICMGTHSQALLQNHLMDVYETW